MGSGALVAGTTVAGALTASGAIAGDPLAWLGIVGGLTPYQRVILHGYGGAIFMLALGYAGYRWPTRTMRLAATASVRQPVRSPSDFRVWLFRVFSVFSGGLGLFLLVWTTAQWL